VLASCDNIHIMEQILYTLCLLHSLMHLVSELLSFCSYYPCSMLLFQESAMQTRGPPCWGSQHLSNPSIQRGIVGMCLCLSLSATSRTARVEKDWTRNQRKLRITADLCPLYFNDCTALLGLITMEPHIRSGQFFLIPGQGHILSNSIFLF
jgi:hypothetical protein